MRKKIIVGNWKMFKTPEESIRDYNLFSEKAASLSSRLDMGFAAPFISLPSISPKQHQAVRVYAQNCHWEKEGAFTGEISTGMLASINTKGALVAHSERRQYFGETNVSAGKRVAALVACGMEAIFCIGETLAQRKNGELNSVLRSQLFEAFEAAGFTSLASLGWQNNAPLMCLAYEPVWAIGTGLAATPVEAQEAHAQIRALLTEKFGADCANKVRILYGGSVNPANVASFMQCPDIDGALVGGASLKPDGFLELCTKAVG